jgi:hypothetical protein
MQVPPRSEAEAMRVGQLLRASFAVFAALVVVGCAGSASPQLL